MEYVSNQVLALKALKAQILKAHTYSFLLVTNIVFLLLSMSYCL